MTEAKTTIKVTVDMTEAMRKTATLRMIPKAFRKNAEDWAGETIRYIKQSYKGGRVFKRPPKEFDLRLGHLVKPFGTERAEIILGTGQAIGREPVVYAEIHERGGWIVPKKARALTIPFPGVKGVAANYRANSFIIKKQNGANVGMIATVTGKRGKLKPLFLLRKSVRLPARYWFSTPIAERIPFLTMMMSEEGVWARASQMAYSRTAAQGGE